MNQLAKREQYDIQMLFDKKTAKTDLAPMVKLVNDLLKWKGWDKLPPKDDGSAAVKKPFMDGDTKRDSAGVLYSEKNPCYKGMIYISSWSKNAPGVVDPTGKHPITQHDEIYGGCWCRAQLNAYAYDQAGNKGVSFGLIHIQKIKDDKPFGNRTRPEDAFAAVENTDAGASDAEMFG